MNGRQFFGGLPVKELARRVWREAGSEIDKGLGKYRTEKEPPKDETPV
jgi:hypothetical protein